MRQTKVEMFKDMLILAFARSGLKSCGYTLQFKDIRVNDGNTACVTMSVDGCSCEVSYNELYGIEFRKERLMCKAGEAVEYLKTRVDLVKQHREPYARKITESPSPQIAHARGQSKGFMVFQEHLAGLIKEAWEAGNRSYDPLKNPTRAMFKFMREKGYYVPEHFVRSLDNEEDERLDQLRTDR